MAKQTADAKTDREGRLVRREVGSDDPSLSRRANQLLTEELRAAVGSDEVGVPAGTPDRSTDTHATHSSAVASLVANRIGLIITSFVVLTVAVTVSLATGSWWALIPAVAIHAVGAIIVVGSTLQLTTETEHMAPQVAARLEDEGVADPDAMFNDLVEDYAGAEDARGLPEVVSGGHNERTVLPEENHPRSTVEQRTALTPSSEPGPPAGERGTPDVQQAFIVGGAVAVSVVAAFIVGWDTGWVAPVVAALAAVGWLVLRARMDGAGEERAARAGQTRQQGALHRRTGEVGSGMRRRVLPIAAAIVAFAVIFAVVAGLAIGGL